MTSSIESMFGPRDKKSIELDKGICKYCQHTQVFVNVYKGFPGTCTKCKLSRMVQYPVEMKGNPNLCANCKYNDKLEELVAESQALQSEYPELDG